MNDSWSMPLIPSFPRGLMNYVVCPKSKCSVFVELLCLLFFVFSDPPCLGDFTSHSLSISVHLILGPLSFLFALSLFPPFVMILTCLRSSTWYGIKKLEAH